MIRWKTFDEARVMKKWQVIIDAAERGEGFAQKNEHYLSRCYNKGTVDDMTAISGYRREIVQHFPDDLNGAVISLFNAAAKQIGGNMVMLAVKYMAFLRHGLRKNDIEWLIIHDKGIWSELDFSCKIGVTMINRTGGLSCNSFKYCWC